MAGHAVFVRAAMDLYRLVEIAMRRRRGRLPLDGRRVPRIIGSDFLAPGDADEEIQDEGNLREAKCPGRVRNVHVRVQDGSIEADRLLAVRVSRAAIIHAAIEAGEALL